jgi:hypothetical protein
MYSLLLALTFAAPTAFACAKFFHPFNVAGTPFEKSAITFSENEFGPQLDGWKFKANGKEAVGVFFGGRKKTWCAVVQDKKEGTGLDCNFLHHAKAGHAGSGNMIWVYDAKSKNAKPKAFALHGDEHTLTIYTLDPAKPVKNKDPMAAVDTTKPEIILKGWIDVNDKNEARAKMEVIAWDVTANKSAGRAVHVVEGLYSADNAMIKRPQVREGGPPPPIKPLTAFNLVGSHYTAPERCGFGEVGKYEAPADEGQTRVPAKSN